ncbi:organic cation transporter protein [Halyomorpha halys]|uniref:organic cation transporter protein n=1 Tax=Halyomorpha halys TaxID=286706 RepID=UPI0006D5071D|nr:organic cation transporter protein-like [Halyomorpha halys]
MVDEAKTREPAEKDVIAECIGDFGRWQLLMNVLLPLVNFPCAFHMYIPNFITETSATCAKPVNSPLTQHQWIQLSALDNQSSICTIRELDYSHSYESLSQVHTNRTILCSRWDYDTTHLGNTLVTEWDLVCDRKYLLNVAEMMYLMGVAVGGLVCGYISDRFGRKKTLMFSLLCQMVIGVFISWTPWFPLFFILRSILGFFSASVMFSGLVLCMEIVGGKWLTICGVSYMLTVPLSYITISGIAYITRNWRILQLTISLLPILLLPLNWIVPESPRWLLTSYNKDRLKDVLQQAAKFNGKPLSDNVDELIQQSMTKRGEEPPKVRVMDLFRTRYMRKITLVMYVIWFCQCILYYGLVLNVSALGGDVYINSVISGVVEFSAIALSIFVLLKLGTRWPLALGLAGAGAACLFSTLFHKEDLIHLVLITVGRFLISSPNVTVQIYTAELYPTIIRNLGLGSANVAAGVSLILIPYIWLMAGVDESLPIVVIGLGGVLGGLATLLLPETAGWTEDLEKS